MVARRTHRARDDGPLRIVRGAFVIAAPPVTPGQGAIAGFNLSETFALLAAEQLAERDKRTLADIIAGAPAPAFVQRALDRADGRARRILVESFMAGDGADPARLLARDDRPLAWRCGIGDPITSWDFMRAVKAPPSGAARDRDRECRPCAVPRCARRIQRTAAAVHARRRGARALALANAKNRPDSASPREGASIFAAGFRIGGGAGSRRRAGAGPQVASRPLIRTRRRSSRLMPRSAATSSAADDRPGATPSRSGEGFFAIGPPGR